MTRISPTILLLTALCIGPLLVGSYFGGWRWPVILLLAAYALCEGMTRGCTMFRESWRMRILLGLIAVLTVQGIWMVVNRKYDFIQNGVLNGVHHLWHLEPVAHRPFPGLPGGMDDGEAFDRLSFLLPALVALWLIAGDVRTGRLRMPTLFACVFWTGTAVASIGILQRLTGAEGIYGLDIFTFPERPLFFGTFRSPGIASCYLNLCLAVGLSYGFGVLRRALRQGRRSPVYPLLVGVGVVVIASGAVLAGSKAGMVFTLLTLTAWFAWNARTVGSTLARSLQLFPGSSPTEHRIVKGVFIAMLSLAVLGLAGTGVHRWKTAVENDFSTLRSRGEVNAVMRDMIADPEWKSSPAGFGAGSFTILYPFYHEGEADQGAFFYAHNDHLQTLVEWGWMGSACFALILSGSYLFSFRLIRSSATSGRKSEALYAKGTVIGLTVALAHACISFPFQIESIALTLFSLTGSAWGHTPV